MVKFYAQLALAMFEQKKGGERGQNVTVLATVNATGTIILPPMIIFRGKSLREEQIRDGYGWYYICLFCKEFY